MITEFKKYYCPKRHLLASSMTLKYNSGRSRLLISLVGFEGIGRWGLFLPKIIMNISKQ
jgi:hypothetical protein